MSDILKEIKDGVDSRVEPLDKLANTITDYVESNNQKIVEKIQQIENISREDINQNIQRVEKVTNDLKNLIDVHDKRHELLSQMIVKYNVKSEQTNTLVKFFIFVFVSGFVLISNYEKILDSSYENFISQQCKINPISRVCNR